MSGTPLRAGKEGVRASRVSTAHEAHRADFTDASGWPQKVPTNFWLAVSVTAITAVLFARKPDAFLNPQFWAEDGTVFFAQAYSDGLSSLTFTYSGYYHLLPRLVALVAQLCPYPLAPAIYNFAALGGMWAVVAKLHSPRLRLPYPLAYSLVLVLVPHFTGEVFMNLTNVQWPLALLLFLTALQDPPKRRLDWFCDILVITLVGLSTPLVVLVCPVWVVRALWLRSGWLVAVAAISLLVACLQVQAFRSNPVSLAPSAGHEQSVWVELLGHKAFGTFFLGRQVPYKLSPLVLVAAAAVLGTWLVWRLMKSPPTGTRVALPGLAFGLLAMAAAFYKFRVAADLLVPASAAIRYFYLPWVVTCWALVTLVIEERRWLRVPPALLLIVILHSSTTTVFRTPPFKDLGWASYEGRLEAREHLWIPINPPGWRIKVNEPP